jgi:hypothetical protein
MSIINFYNCKNNLEAIQKEQEHFISLNATLNSMASCSLLSNIHKPIEPIIDTVQIIDTIQIADTTIDLKKPNDFQCDKCDFKCFKKGDWNRHILTQKHQYEPSEPEITPSVTEKVQQYTCLCGEVFNSRTTTWRHKKNCNKMSVNKIPANKITMTINEIESSPTMLTEEMVMKLLNQNNDLQKIIMDQNAKMLELVSKTQIQGSHVVQVQTNNSSKVINNTRNFNLNVYLNEVCKEALNLSEFVEGLKVKLLDLEETAQRGYTEGVSRIFINGLNELSENKRPIHCSDLKREVLYIKNEDEWRKEDGSKKEITRAIKRVSNKNIRQINEWQKKYPEFRDPESKESDRYMEMICNTMGGSTDEEQHKNMEKIIRNISREVVIDKSGVLKVKGGGI